MTQAHLFAVGLALAALAGVRAYLTVFGIGLAGLLGWIDLPPALAVASSPWVLATSGVLTLLEFTFDKIPGVDSGWDLLNTLLRIPVGAFLAAATLSPDGDLTAGALTAGAATALLTHGIKAGTRATLNASPEPVTNWTASLGDDAVAITSLALVFSHPWLALGLLLGVMGLFALMVAWVVRAIVRRVRRPAVAG